MLIIFVLKIFKFSVTNAVLIRVNECQGKETQNCRLQMQHFYNTQSNHFFLSKKKFKAKPDGFIYLLTPWLKDYICFSFTVSIKKSKKL